jgi:5'-3' exonuclease
MQSLRKGQNYYRSLSSLNKVYSFSRAKSKPLKSAKTDVFFHHKNLPSETLYILDGTAMLYYAYFSSSSRTEFQNATFTSYFSNEWVSKQSAETIDRFQAEFSDLNTNTAESTPATTRPFDPSALSCSALVAMARNFAHFVNQVHPSYLAITFDSSVPTFRKQLFPAYKKQRKKVLFVGISSFS